MTDFVAYATRPLTDTEWQVFNTKPVATVETGCHSGAIAQTLTLFGLDNGDILVSPGGEFQNSEPWVVVGGFGELNVEWLHRVLLHYASLILEMFEDEPDDELPELVGTFAPYIVQVRGLEEWELSKPYAVIEIKEKRHED